MLLAIALVIAAPQQPRLDQLIAEWCSTNNSGSQGKCEAKQGRALQRFLALSSKIADPRRRIASDCLHQSARVPSLDWKVAAHCMSLYQAAAIDRRTTSYVPTSGPPVMPGWLPGRR